MDLEFEEGVGEGRQDVGFHSLLGQQDLLGTPATTSSAADRSSASSCAAAAASTSTCSAAVGRFSGDMYISPTHAHLLQVEPCHICPGVPSITVCCCAAEAALALPKPEYIEGWHVQYALYMSGSMQDYI